MQPLTAVQKRKAEAFVRAHAALQTADERARAKRLDAAEAAYKAGVFGTTLAELSGLGPARVYQLIDELKDAGRIPSENETEEVPSGSR